MRKIKILHIGPTYAPPMCDVIRQIKEHTDFSNVVISNNSTRFIMPDGFFSDITLYEYDYYKNDTENPEMCSFVENVLKVEKPDLIIGHCLSYTSVMLNCVLNQMDIPAIAYVWGNGCFMKRLKKPLYAKMFFDNLRVISKLNYIAVTFQTLRDICAYSYGINQEDFAFSGPPINLAQYTDHAPNTSHGPVLFLAKPRGDKLVYPILPEVFKRFPGLKVHAFSLEPGVTLARKFNVHKRIMFHPMLSQQDFSDVMRRCNIVHTVTGDAGLGGTALQAAYAGCINLMRGISTTSGILDNGINALMCAADPGHIFNKLVYSIEHLSNLCKRFKKNNQHLIRYDQEHTWNGLYEAITACIEGRKGKIIPTCAEAQQQKEIDA